MSTLNPNDAYTLGILGKGVKKTQTIATETRDLFTVSGLVLVTGIVGKVTTALTVANTVKLVANPTTGTSSDLCAATDLGSTDTPAGNLLSITGAPAEVIFTGIGAAQRMPVTEAQPTAVTTVMTGGAQGIYVTAGIIQAVVTGTNPDGVIDWWLHWVPVEAGATVVAA
jgi:hypothetical protein